MLRMMLLGLLIPCGVGVLAAMELKTPPRTLATAGQPVAETTVGISDSHGALPKADRLDVTYARSETPTQPGILKIALPDLLVEPRLIIRLSLAAHLTRTRDIT